MSYISIVEANQYFLLVGLDNEDETHNINPVICFLTKGNVVENLKQSKHSVF